MEENKIKICEEHALLEGECESTSQVQREKNQKKQSYLIVTISFFILMIACIFSEIGYDFVKRDEAIHFLGVLGEPELKNDFEKSYSKQFIKMFFGVEKIHKLQALEDNINNLDELPKIEQQKDDYIPVEADTDAETQLETQIKETIQTETETKYPVITLDLSQKHLGENYIVNETGYVPEIEKLKNTYDNFDVLLAQDKELPTVLIIHTHGTESYLEDGKMYYTESDGEISRTKDKEKNVVAIGKIIAEKLNSAGIKTIHCEIMHDEESYQDSYTRASESIKSYLAKYPSIKYVFDIHRDAILKSDGSLVKTITEIERENVAQIMTVVGSNYKGADFPDWERNLVVALKLKQILDEDNLSFSRPVYLRGAAYNQQYAPCSLLLEIGTSGNTLKEAKKAAEIVSEALVKLISELSH